MKLLKHSILIMAVLFMCSSVSFAGSASGGGISNTPGKSNATSIAIDNSGNYIVTWADDTSGSNKVYIKKFEKSGWVEMGEGSASGDGIASGWGSIATDELGIPYIVWTDNGEIYLKKWNGSSWEQIGYGSASGLGISGNYSVSVHPHLVTNSSGNPIVAWENRYSDDRVIYVKQYIPNE